MSRPNNGNIWGKKVTFSEVVGKKTFQSKKEEKNGLINRLSKLSPQDRDTSNKCLVSLGTVRLSPRKILMDQQENEKNQKNNGHHIEELSEMPLILLKKRSILDELECDDERDSPEPIIEEEFEAESRTRQPPISVREPEPILYKVSEKHLIQIQRLLNDGNIQTDLILKTLLAIDFEFYCPVSTVWMAETVRILENSLKVLMEGSRVLLLFSNIYVAAALAKIVGVRGTVVTFGNKQEIKSLRSSGLADLLTSRRLIVVTANELNLGLTNLEFESFGYIEQSPYDLIVVKGSRPHNVPDILQLQLNECGVIFDGVKGAKLFESGPEVKQDFASLDIHEFPPHLWSAFNFLS